MPSVQSLVGTSGDEHLGAVMALGFMRSSRLYATLRHGAHQGVDVGRLAGATGAQNRQTRARFKELDEL